MWLALPDQMDVKSENTTQVKKNDRRLRQNNNSVMKINQQHYADVFKDV